ncbi:MAG: methyltransferase [Candidatus Heimdallarchaeota archaeon]|nr:methyltransferase [Candidatus Heimdallarchaeota archaeon]
MRKVVDGLSLDIPSEVYDPAEDSFLLAENVHDLTNEKVLEVGSGSGYVSLYLAKKFPRADFFCVEINHIAANATKKNAKQNSVNLEVLCSDLFTSLHAKENNLQFFDIVLFNSPYLPVKDFGLLEQAWSGGIDGLDVVKPFLKALPFFLKNNGSCYLVVSSKTNLALLENMIEFQGFNCLIKDKIVEGKESILLYYLKKNITE